MDELERVDCVYCSGDLEGYVSTTATVIKENYELQSFAANTAQASRVLAPGRVLVINNMVCARVWGRSMRDAAWRLLTFVFARTLPVSHCSTL